jgi:hypothetical protein
VVLKLFFVLLDTEKIGIPVGRHMNTEVISRTLASTADYSARVSDLMRKQQKMTARHLLDPSNSEAEILSDGPVGGLSSRCQNNQDEDSPSKHQFEEEEEKISAPNPLPDVPFVPPSSVDPSRASREVQEDHALFRELSARVTEVNQLAGLIQGERDA